MIDLQQKNKILGFKINQKLLIITDLQQKNNIVGFKISKIAHNHRFTTKNAMLGFKILFFLTNF